MTIYERKRKTAKTAPYYFSRRTMKAFGQTLKDYSVVKQKDGRYRISANYYSVKYFNPITNNLE